MLIKQHYYFTEITYTYQNEEVVKPGAGVAAQEQVP